MSNFHRTLFWQETEAGWSVRSVNSQGQLFNISCLWGRHKFLNIMQNAYNIWAHLPDFDLSDLTMAEEFKQNWDINAVGDYIKWSK